ncbi:hypothetical protein H1J94_004918, partial [Salmonella enterica]|nr:hypothetical protein [Salmonella enterica]
ALSAFLKHTADMARAADFMAGHLEAMADAAEGWDELTEENASELATAPLPEKGMGTDNPQSSEFDVYSEILNGGKRA